MTPTLLDCAVAWIFTFSTGGIAPIERDCTVGAALEARQQQIEVEKARKEREELEAYVKEKEKKEQEEIQEKI